METLLTLSLSGSALALLLLLLRRVFVRQMPSTVYYYAWLLVLLRFALPAGGRRGGYRPDPDCRVGTDRRACAPRL